VRFCPEHWEALRAAIDARGLGSLVADSGEQAASNLAAEMEQGSTVDNFDPLMGAHNAIMSRAIDEIAGRYQQNALMLMANEDDPAVTWPTCPVCALTWCHEEHNRICEKPGCDYPAEFDWDHEMINGAADHMVKTWQELNA
jgi:hypothetical protein